MHEETKEKLYRKHKSEFTRYLRHNMTPEEIILWEALRNRRCHNMKFRRQVNIGPYIADFLCMQHRLIIEVDGSVHNLKEHREYDRSRDKYFHELNFRVLRIKNNEIYVSLPSVLNRIQKAMFQNIPPSPDYLEK